MVEIKYIIIIIYYLIKLTQMDMISCRRANCFHCDVRTVAQMCPQICGRCPERQRIMKHQSEIV